MRHLSLLLLALALLGCNAAAPGDLDAARRAWAATDSADYEFTIVKECFCTPEMSGPFVISVRGDERSITREGVPVEDRWLVGLPADAEMLFAFVAERVSQQGFRATYDQTSGFVLSVWSDPIPEAVDDELGLRISNLVIR
jgi:hypothetical protein